MAREDAAEHALRDRRAGGAIWQRQSSRGHASAPAKWRTLRFLRWAQSTLRARPSQMPSTWTPLHSRRASQRTAPQGCCE
eukprot:scaffold131571_cov28-Tisochrysis_lutea.AAC.1